MAHADHRPPTKRTHAVRALTSVFLATGLWVAACTVFDGLEARRPGPSNTDADADQPVVGFLGIDDAARACSQIFKCPRLPRSVLFSISVPIDNLNFSQCMDWLAGPLPANRPGRRTQAQVLACIANARTCAEAGGCLSFEYIDPSDNRCSDAGGAAYCDKDRKNAVVCLDDPVVAHCGSAYFAPNSKCHEDDAGLLGCGIDLNCPRDAAASPGFCNGSLRDFCSGLGVHVGIFCESMGLTCGVDRDSGRADCLGSNGERATCTTAGAACKGDKIEVCDGVYRSEFDCTALDGACVQTGNAVRCARSEEECTPLDPDVNQCAADSDELTLCVGGRRRVFDCAAVGLKCAAAAGPQTARCR